MYSQIEVALVGGKRKIHYGVDAALTFGSSDFPAGQILGDGFIVKAGTVVTTRLPIGGTVGQTCGVFANPDGTFFLSPYTIAPGAVVQTTEGGTGWDAAAIESLQVFTLGLVVARGWSVPPTTDGGTYQGIGLCGLPPDAVQGTYTAGQGRADAGAGTPPYGALVPLGNGNDLPSLFCTNGTDFTSPVLNAPGSTDAVLCGFTKWVGAPTQSSTWQVNDPTTGGWFGYAAFDIGATKHGYFYQIVFTAVVPFNDPIMQIAVQQQAAAGPSTTGTINVVAVSAVLIGSGETASVPCIINGYGDSLSSATSTGIQTTCVIQVFTTAETAPALENAQIVFAAVWDPAGSLY